MFWFSYKLKFTDDLAILSDYCSTDELYECFYYYWDVSLH